MIINCDKMTPFVPKYFDDTKKNPKFIFTKINY